MDLEIEDNLAAGGACIADEAKKLRENTVDDEMRKVREQAIAEACEAAARNAAACARGERSWYDDDADAADADGADDAGFKVLLNDLVQNAACNGMSQNQLDFALNDMIQNGGRNKADQSKFYESVLKFVGANRDGEFDDDKDDEYGDEYGDAYGDAYGEEREKKTSSMLAPDAKAFAELKSCVERQTREIQGLVQALARLESSVSQLAQK